MTFNNPLYIPFSSSRSHLLQLYGNLPILEVHACASTVGCMRCMVGLNKSPCQNEKMVMDVDLDLIVLYQRKVGDFSRVIQLLIIR
jgi:hypothetical protein